MKVNTKKRKKARQGFQQIYGAQEPAAMMFHVLQAGKQGLDALHMELGAMLCETVMDMEREELSGPDYAPRSQGAYKWAYQDGSVYCGDRKIQVRYPRLRGPEGEIHLSSYQTLKSPGAFSEELLGKVLCGISERRSSTNPIENMFSTVRDCEGNIKRYRNSAMSQRWLAALLLHWEKGFRRIKGYADIAKLLKEIDQYFGDQIPVAA